MAKSAGDLESGLTRFLNTLYACFRFMSRFLILCQFCECPTIKRKTRKRKSEDQFEDGMSTGFDTETDVTRRGFTFPKRYILVIMTFLGFMNMYALRVNLNVAIGAMVNNHTIQAKGYTITRVSKYVRLFCECVTVWISMIFLAKITLFKSNYLSAGIEGLS